MDSQLRQGMRGTGRVVLLVQLFRVDPVRLGFPPAQGMTKVSRLLLRGRLNRVYFGPHRVVTSRKRGGISIRLFV